jgi:hypothetical protein
MCIPERVSTSVQISMSAHICGPAPLHIVFQHSMSPHYIMHPSVCFPGLHISPCVHVSMRHLQTRFLNAMLCLSCHAFVPLVRNAWDALTAGFMRSLASNLQGHMVGIDASWSGHLSHICCHLVLFWFRRLAVRSISDWRSFSDSIPFSS